jgi:hypothetical protein
MVGFLDHRKELNPAPVASRLSPLRLLPGAATSFAGARISATWLKTTRSRQFELLWCERGDLNPHEVAFTRS